MTRVRMGLSASALMTVVLAGCASHGAPREGEAASESYRVSSDPDRGVLARIDYPDAKASVEFLDYAEDGIGYLVRYPADGVNPLVGSDFHSRLPGEAFLALTGESPPAALTQAEERVLADGGQLIDTADVEAGEDASGIGVSTQGLIAWEFREACHSDAQVCTTSLQSNRTFKSGQKRISADVHAHARRGDMRLRVQYKRRRTWRGVGSAVQISEGDAVIFGRSLGTLLQRYMRVVVDQVTPPGEGAYENYDIMVKWSDSQFPEHLCGVFPDFDCL